MIRAENLQEWYKQKRVITLTNRQISNLATFLRIFLHLSDDDKSKYQSDNCQFQKEEIEAMVVILETAEINREGKTVGNRRNVIKNVLDKFLSKRRKIQCSR